MIGSKGCAGKARWQSSPYAGNPCWMCETTLRPHHHSLPSVAGRRGKPSVPRTDRHEVLHIMAPDNARKPCAGTALRGHEMHTVPIRRDHEHGGPLGTIRLDICQHVLHRPRSEIRSGPVARLSVNLGVRSRLSVSGRRQYPQCVPSPPQVPAIPPQEIQRLLS